MGRESRNVLVPLYGDDMNVGSDAIGIAVSVSYLVDSCLFPFVGYLSDKHGRKVTGNPAFACLSIGLLALATANSFGMLVLTALLIGFGNGLSSGLVMTTGVDAAPPEPETGVFLGWYAVFYDSGSFAGPVLIGLTAYAGGNFKVSGFVVACIGIFGTAWYVCLVPETRGSPSPQSPV